MNFDYIKKGGFGGKFGVQMPAKKVEEPIKFAPGEVPDFEAINKS